MIRVRKCGTIPRSLEETAAYGNEDVVRQLAEDQYGKCYICERHLAADFEIEHLRGRSSELSRRWDNLFLACNYCNKKKSNRYHNILNPLSVNVEEEITQEIDYLGKLAVFTCTHGSPEHDETVKLLDLIFNGTRKGLRTYREERFFEYAMSVINRFYNLVTEYLFSSDAQSEILIREELMPDKEFLGFKFHIVKSSPVLYKAFCQDMLWNR